jgi:hypothetical protein
LRPSGCPKDERKSSGTQTRLQGQLMKKPTVERISQSPARQHLPSRIG